MPDRLPHMVSVATRVCQADMSILLCAQKNFRDVIVRSDILTIKSIQTSKRYCVDVPLADSDPKRIKSSQWKSGNSRNPESSRVVYRLCLAELARNGRTIPSDNQATFHAEE